MEVVTIYVTFMTSCGLANAEPYYYYYIHNDERMNVTEMPEQVNITKLVVDFRVTILLAYFALFKDDGMVIDYKKASTRYLNVTKDYRSPCSYKKYFKEDCVYQPASQLTVEMDTAFETAALEAHRFDLEHFIGCFEAHNVPNSIARVKNGKNCATHCRISKYYGSNDSHCICLWKLTEVELVPANLQSCDIVTGSPAVWLQGTEHFAIFSRKKLSNYQPRAYPSWECLFEYRDCPICSRGWMGLYCNIHDCSIKNGDCGEDRECQNIFIQDYVVVAVCKCHDGSTINDYLDCYESNSSSIERETSYIFNAISFLLGLLLCLIIIATALLLYQVQKYF